MRIETCILMWPAAGCLHSNSTLFTADLRLAIAQNRVSRQKFTKQNSVTATLYRNWATNIVRKWTIRKWTDADSATTSHKIYVAQRSSLLISLNNLEEP
jgi:hypothetical protein